MSCNGLAGRNLKRQFDAGVQLGEAIARDMVAVRIGSDVSYSVVGSPEYFERYPVPESPQDLMEHNCANLRGGVALTGWCGSER